MKRGLEEGQIKHRGVHVVFVELISPRKGLEQSLYGLMAATRRNMYNSEWKCQGKKGKALGFWGNAGIPWKVLKSSVVGPSVQVNTSVARVA